MKFKHKDIECSRRLFEVEFSSDTVKKKYEEICGHMKKVASIPGYRTGKAPMDLLKKMHGDKIKEETIQDLVPYAYRQVLEESKTEPVGMPEVSDLNFDIEKGLSFKIKVDIRPKVNLKKYKNIPVKKQKSEVKKEDIDKYLSILQESNAKFNDITDRAIKMGDYIVCDLECLIDNKPIYPQRKGVWIAVEKTNPMPGLVEGLIDHNAGEALEIKTTMPGDFQEAKYRNKQALLKINILKIKEKQVSKLDDEFAKSLGGYKNLEELKQAVKMDLARKLEDRIRNNVENQILTQLLKDANFDVPAELVERETKRLIEFKKKEFHRQGVGEDKLPKDEKLENESKEDAAKRVRLYFILDEIAKREGIEVNDKELEQVIESLAKEYGKTKDELSKYYKEHNHLEGLRDQLKEHKVIDFLITNANIKQL